MADLLDFLPVFEEDATTIRARMDADANAGLSVGDPAWVDTRQGTFYWDITQVILLELARIWDALGTEVVAAAFPLFAWGVYLDYHAALFGLERKAAVAATGTVRFAGTDGTIVGTGTIVSAPPPTDSSLPLEFATTASGTIAGGFVDLAVQATVAGAAGNVAAGAIDTVESPAPGVDSVTNQTAMIDGTDIENDDDLRTRVLLEFEGHGAGVINDYVRWALSRAGVGRVSVVPVWQGPGTVQVVVLTSDNQPVSAGVVTDVQNYLDPTAGTADGVAPPGITVTVQTPSTTTISIAAAVTFKDGYSLDGTGGTIEQRSIITKALNDYITGLAIGENVVYQHVLGQFFRAVGVYSIAGLTVNGGTADIVMGANPPQVAVLATPTLS